MHHTQGVWGLGVFFVYGGLRLRNGAVNDQRQDTIAPTRRTSKNGLVSNKVFHCISRKSVFQ